MPLVAAQCTNCGAALQVDNTKDAAVCQYCGSAFIVEKAIHNYEINNTYQIENANIVINDDKSFAKRLAAADEYLYQLQEYDAAYHIYAEIESIAPGNHKVWYGKIGSRTHHFNADETAEMIVENPDMYADLERDIANAYRTVTAEEKASFQEKIAGFLNECKNCLQSMIDDLGEQKKSTNEQGDAYKDDIRDIEKSNENLDKQIRKMNRNLDTLYYTDKVVIVLMKIAMALGFFAVLVGIIGLAMSFNGSPEYFGFSFLFLAIGICPALILFIIHKIMDSAWYRKDKVANAEKDKLNQNNRIIGGRKKEIKEASKQIVSFDKTVEEYRNYMNNIEATIAKYQS